MKPGMLKNSERFFNIPDDIGLDGFQPSFCRNLHRNFYKMEGKTDQDPIKNAEIPTDILRGCKKHRVF